MKTYNTKPPGLLKLAALAILGFVATTVFVQGTALAITGAGTVISNTATVSWEDSNNQNAASTTASVNVTVNLLEATPTLSSPGNLTVASNNNADYTYTITSNANGLDTYNLTATQGAITGVLDSFTDDILDSTGTVSITDIDLGASSVYTAATAGDTAITVASDGSGAGGDTEVHGIAAGDTVLINGATYTVASTVDNASGTSTINLTTGLAANASVGTQIGEQAQFIFRFTPVSTTDGTTVVYTVSARDDANADPAATDPTTTTISFAAPSITVTKFVANTSNPVVGGGSNITVDTGLGAGSTTYYTTGVTGQPGDTLEYIIQIVNAGGEAREVIISDPVPTYTSYSVADQMALDPGTGTWGALTDDDSDGDAGETDGNVIYIYAGSSGNDGAAGVNNGSGGSLNGGDTTRGAFRVTID
jgi:hypothetical protein